MKHLFAATAALVGFAQLSGVMRSRLPDPARRYLMGFISIEVNYTGPRPSPHHPRERRGFGVAASPDGLRWTLVNSWATDTIIDGPTYWLLVPKTDRSAHYGRAMVVTPEAAKAWGLHGMPAVPMTPSEHAPYRGKDSGPMGAGVGYASIKRDRFVSLTASFDGGTLVTRPLRIAGRTLRLNAKADYGSIVVEALDAAGQVRAKSKPWRRDSLNGVVEWETGALPDNEPVTLRLQLSNAHLFALWSS